MQRGRGRLRYVRLRIAARPVSSNQGVMKIRNDHSLWWLGGAVALMASSITCITLLETRRARAQARRRSVRALQEATEKRQSEGGAILADKSRVAAPVF